MSRFRIAVPVSLLITLSLTALPLFASDTLLATAPVHKAMMADTYVADARIEAVHQATVAAETTGRIKDIYFDVDDVVQAGDVLLRFTDTQQRAELSRAEAALRETQARLSEAEKEHARITSIYAQKLVPKSAMDKADADLDAAKQRVVASEAGVKQAREQLEYTVVRAPYAGIVVQRHVSAGEPVRPGTPLMTGFSLAQLRATATVPQSVVDAVRKQAKAEIVISSVADPIQVVGKAITVYPYADPVAHSFTVRMNLESVPEGVYPGMFAKASFVVGEQDGLFVPRLAVVHRSEVTAVYVVDAQGQVGFRSIRVGRVLGDRIQVLAGLDEGEAVALDPVNAGIVLKEQRAAKVGAAQ